MLILGEYLILRNVSGGCLVLFIPVRSCFLLVKGTC